MRLKQSIFILFILFSTIVKGQQNRFDVIENKLRDLSKDTPGLNEKVELSVNGITIQDFIRGLATTNNLNVSVDAGLTVKIYNNFTNVTVADVIMFLAKKYDLDVSFIGNIMSFTLYSTPPAIIPPIKYTAKTLKITYDKTSNLLSLDLSKDSLALVVKELTKVSGKNVVFASDLAGKIVSGYIQNMQFSSALDKFAFANDLKVTATKDDFYLIEKMDAVGSNPKNNGKPGNASSGSSSTEPSFSLKTDGNKLITIEAVNTPIAEILSSVSKELKTNYFLFSEPKGNTSLSIEKATYDVFLNHLFNGTDYTFNRDSSSIYMIGDRAMEGLRSTKVLPLQYRTVEKVVDFIPVKLKEGVEVKEFRDLNSLIVCGSLPRIEELEKFLRQIDRVVPVISIEVYIVDVNNSHAVETGIKAGLGTAPTTTSGEVFPEVNLNLGAGAINSVIDGINGLGIANLGKVTPNFYVSLQLMEKNGDVNIRSTPLLCTLNGTEAKMNIGETRFYEETNTNTISTQSTTTVQSKMYKPLNAEFLMTINPIVSGDEQITVSITVKQSSFTGQSNGAGSPYNTSTRDFQSLIRVKNQEMIMLGGLDNDTKNETSSGVPVLSRIPIIKWFFSSRLKSKAKSKLTIFIKPTVIY